MEHSDGLAGWPTPLAPFPVVFCLSVRADESNVQCGNGSSVQAGGVNIPFYVKVVVTDACNANNGPRTARDQKFVFS
jgi:hypothetical protein